MTRSGDGITLGTAVAVGDPGSGVAVGGRTKTVAVDVLSSGCGSNSFALTVAVLVRVVPAASGVAWTTIEMWMISPTARAPTVQVRAWPATAQVPRSGVADTNVVFAGSVSVTTTPVAAPGPSLRTTKWKVSSAPTATGLGIATLKIPGSDAGVAVAFGVEVTVGDGVAVGVSVAVSVGVAVTVGVAVNVGVAVSVGPPGVGVLVAVGDGPGVKVLVAVGVKVAVGVAVAVLVRVGVAVAVFVAVGVEVAVGVGVLVGANTLVVTVDVLFPGLGSGVVLDTVAVFVIVVPAAAAVGWTTIFTPATGSGTPGPGGGRFPSEQVTVPLLPIGGVVQLRPAGTVVID